MKRRTNVCIILNYFYTICLTNVTIMIHDELMIYLFIFYYIFIIHDFIHAF